MTRNKNGNSTAIQPWKAVVNDLRTPAGAKELQAALPSQIDSEQLIRSFVTAVKADKSGTLAKCSKDSLAHGVMTAASLGLSLVPALGHAYLIAFYDSRSRCHKAQLVPGYRGYIHLAYQTGMVERISARPVYENDEFFYSYGTKEEIRHVPALHDAGRLICTYCVVWLKGSDHPSFTVVTMDKIEQARKSSKSKTGPWVTHFDEMAIKTAVRRHAKMIPLSAEDKASNILAQTMALEEQIEHGRRGMPQRGTIDVEQLDDIFEPEPDAEFIEVDQEPDPDPEPDPTPEPDPPAEKPKKKPPKKTAKPAPDPEEPPADPEAEESPWMYCKKVTSRRHPETGLPWCLDCHIRDGLVDPNTGELIDKG